MAVIARKVEKGFVVKRPFPSTNTLKRHKKHYSLVPKPICKRHQETSSCVILLLVQMCYINYLTIHNSHSLTVLMKRKQNEAIRSKVSVNVDYLLQEQNP